MELEQINNELANIKQEMADLKLMEDIFLLAKFSQDAKNMLSKRFIEEVKIYGYFYEKDILKKFVTEYYYQDSDGIKHKSKDTLYSQLRCCHGKFRNDEYVAEYRYVAGIMGSKFSNGQAAIVINESTTPEDFLKQLDPAYAIKYEYYNLNKTVAMNSNDEKRTPKTKI